MQPPSACDRGDRIRTCDLLDPNRAGKRQTAFLAAPAAATVAKLAVFSEDFKPLRGALRARPADDEWNDQDHARAARFPGLRDALRRLGGIRHSGRSASMLMFSKGRGRSSAFLAERTQSPPLSRAQAPSQVPRSGSDSDRALEGISGISSYVRPFNSLPERSLRRPPHCLKKK